MDSGIGGSSIFFELLKLFPYYNYLYFCDNKNAPYGNKNDVLVRKIIIDNIENIRRDYNIKMLILACNTATSVSADYIRKNYDFPVIGVEPPVKVAYDLDYKDITVLATLLTIKKNKNIKLYLRKKDLKINCIALKELASLIDKNCNNLNKIKPYLEEKLKNINSQCIVLGCTHYNLIKDLIQQIKPQINVISCEKSVASHSYNIILKNNFSKLSNNIIIQLSKDDKKIKKFFVKNINSFVQNDIHLETKLNCYLN